MAPYDAAWRYAMLATRLDSKRSVWLPRVEAAIRLRFVGGGALVPFCAEFERDAAASLPPPWAPSPFHKPPPKKKGGASRNPFDDGGAPDPGAAGQGDMTFEARARQRA